MSEFNHASPCLDSITQTPTHACFFIAGTFSSRLVFTVSQTEVFVDVSCMFQRSVSDKQAKRDEEETDEFLEVKTHLCPSQDHIIRHHSLY